MNTFKILMCGFLFFSSCSRASNVEQLNPDEFERKIASTPDAVIIDVRTPAEYGEGHLKNAINIDYRSADFQQQIDQLDKSKTYFVYCRSGGRSASAVKDMSKAGFNRIIELKGGIINWQKNNKETVLN